MPVFTYSIPSGVPGSVTRSWSAVIEPQTIDASNAPTAYGEPVVLDASGVRQPTGSDTAASIYGFVVRSFPTQGAYAVNNGFGAGAPPSSDAIVDVLRAGYMSVLLQGATAAAKGGQVFIRIAAGESGRNPGSIEAAADSSNTVALTNAQFMGSADSNGNVEIAFNL